jgi:protein-tyrosine-phosphatase
MGKDIRNVLFLCTGNSARSILAEALVNKLGAGRFRGYSAGSQPLPRPNPLAIETLERKDCPVGELRSKSWDEFAAPGAPEMDFIFTVCDNAAGEACPLWPGRPASAHWGIPDPAAVEGDKAAQLAAFDQAYRAMHARISKFVALPFEELDKTQLKRALSDIGNLPGAGGE